MTLSVQDFAKAYLAGNEAAQTSEDGAYQIADSLGFARGSDEWEAAVGGAAAFKLRGHTFETKAANL